MNFFDKKRRAVLAGFLAAVVLLSSLTGCQGAAQEQLQTALKGIENIFSQVQSAQTSSNPASASPAGVPSAAARPTAKVKNPVTSGTQVGNQSVQKIAIDQSAETTQRAAVPQGKVSDSKYTKIDQRTGYASLSDSVSRSVYNEMLKNVYEIAVKPASSGYYPVNPITLTGTKLTEAQLRIVLLAFLNDNPQVFWVANAFSYQYSGSSMTVQLYSTVSQSQCSAMLQTLNQKVTSVMNGIPAGLSELDRELYLSEYLVAHCTYDTAAVTDETRWKAFNAYGALAEGSVVCEGYARAMQLLSSYAGLPCSLVTGTGNGGNHMWNQVKIGGSWYYLDLTWDDNNPEIYNYFNVTDDVIRQTHTIFPLVSSLSASQIAGTAGAPSGFNLFLPACSATAANYYRAKGIRISALSGSSDASAIGAIVGAARQKKAAVSFYIEDSLNYSDTMSGMLSTAPQKLFYYLIQANKQLPSGNKIVTNSIQYMEDSPNRGLTVYLTYQ